MIITVTMNPAIDKTIVLNRLNYGGLNRIQESVLDIGGKGINVSKTIKNLGGETLATGVIAGNSGQLIKDTLEKLEIKTDFLSISGETRTNTKMIEQSGLMTEFNEAGPELLKESLEDFMKKLERLASPEVLFVLAGSVPKGVPDDIYKNIIELVKEKGAKVFLDADGALFAKGLEANPDFIKPNRFELEFLYGQEENLSEEKLIKMGHQLRERGIPIVIISLGKEGAIFLIEDNIYKTLPIEVDVHSAVGAGDAMVAAFAYGIDTGLDIIDCIRLSVATSTGAVTTIGTKPPTRDIVINLMKSVVIHKL